MFFTKTHLFKIILTAIIFTKTHLLVQHHKIKLKSNLYTHAHSFSNARSLQTILFRFLQYSSLVHCFRSSILNSKFSFQLFLLNYQILLQWINQIITNFSRRRLTGFNAFCQVEDYFQITANNSFWFIILNPMIQRVDSDRFPFEILYFSKLVLHRIPLIICARGSITVIGGTLREFGRRK